MAEERINKIYEMALEELAESNKSLRDVFNPEPGEAFNGNGETFGWQIMAKHYEAKARILRAAAFISGKMEDPAYMAEVELYNQAAQNCGLEKVFD